MKRDVRNSSFIQHLRKNLHFASCFSSCVDRWSKTQSRHGVSAEAWGDGFEEAGEDEEEMEMV